MDKSTDNLTIAGMKRDRAAFKANNTTSKDRKNRGGAGDSRSNNNKATPQDSNTVIRKRIRDTERLLRRPKITADVKVAAERRLKALHLQLEEGSRISLEKRRSNKYKMVRFIEEQKVRRKLEKKKKQLRQTTDTDHSNEQKINRIQNEINELEIDLNYILHFPNDKKYIALFASSNNNNEDNTNGNDRTAQRRNKIREQIRLAMEKGEFDSITLPRSTSARNKKKITDITDTTMDDFFAEDSEDNE